MQQEQRFSALYVRDFRLFWLGQIISLSGTWMHSVAQSWLVYSLTKSPLYLGIIASLSSIPILLFTLLGGMVADRYPKRNILITTQTLSIIPALSVAILSDMNIITAWHVGIAAFFLGTINAFDVPARQAFLGEVVEKANITNAIALNSTAFNGARIIGPIIAGYIIASFGIPACFYINAISFIPVIFALSNIKATGKTEASHEPLSVRHFIFAIVDGWKFVAREKRILYILSLIAIFSLFGIPYITLLPVIADEVLHTGAKGLSLLVASAGAGSFIAAITIAFKGEIQRKDRYIPLSGLIFSLAIFAVGFSKNIYTSMSLLFFAGLGIVSFLAVSNSFIQHVVPDHLRGRIMSLYTLVFLGFSPVGNSSIGITAHFLGTILSLKTFAIVCIVGSIIFLKLFRKEASK